MVLARRDRIEIRERERETSLESAGEALDLSLDKVKRETLSLERCTIVSCPSTTIWLHPSHLSSLLSYCLLLTDSNIKHGLTSWQNARLKLCFNVNKLVWSMNAHWMDTQPHRSIPRCSYLHALQRSQIVPVTGWRWYSQVIRCNDKLQSVLEQF